MENQENPKINITPKDKPEIKITKKTSPEILITQKITDTLRIEDIKQNDHRDNLNSSSLQSFGKPISNREYIKRIVDLPLIEACEILYDKNIKTVETSANQKDIESGAGYISIDLKSLSEVNKLVAQAQGGRLSTLYKTNESDIYILEIPISKDMLVKDISKNATELANKFQKQKFTWMSGGTLEDRITQIEKQRSIYKNSDSESFNREIERLKQPGAWEAECKGYFDAKTQTCWDSEELLKKFNDNDIK